MLGKQYNGGSDNGGFKIGGYKSQLTDDPPGDYMVTSHPNEDPPEDVNSYGQSSGIFESSVVERTSRRGVSTRRDPITFEIGEERK